MQNKRRKIIIITLLAVFFVILPGVFFAGFFWYIPKYWLNKLQNAYLLQYRHSFRVQKILSGSFNKFELQNVQLGNSQKPLFTAPKAELMLSADIIGKFNSLPVKSLTLYDCRFQLDSNRGKIYINGILLENFVKELENLPSAYDGSPLALEIHSVLALGRNAPDSTLHLKIQKTAKKFNVTGVWTSLTNKAVSGSWQAFIDPENDQLAVTLNNYINEVFMQEILLRSGVPAKVTAILNRAMLCGSGSFSGSFNELKINELTYSAQIETPVIAFYKHKLKNIAPFKLEVKKNAKGVFCNIAELKLTGQSSALLKNIKLNCRKKVTFSAECNFHQLAAGILFPESTITVKRDTSSGDLLEGYWDTARDIWHFQSKNITAATGQLQMETADAAVAFYPEKVDLRADGKGSAGTLNQQIKFKDLAIYAANNQKKFQCSKGIFTVRSIFGSEERSNQHTLGISCSNFSGSTPWGVVELPDFSASVDLQTKKDDLLDVFLSFSGSQGKTTVMQTLLTAVDWRGLLRLEIDKKNSIYKLKTLDLKSGKLKVDFARKEYDIPQLHIQLNGSLQKKQLTEAVIKATAKNIIADHLNISEAKIDIDYNTKRSNKETLQGKLSCSKGSFPLSDKHFVRKVSDAVFSFAMPDWKSKPETFTLSAASMEWQRDLFYGTVQNSLWKFQRQQDQSLKCTSEFDFLRLQSKDQKFGRGQFGKSSLDMSIALTPSGAFSRLDILGILSQTSWIKGDYHIGSENIQCDLKFNRQSPTLMHGNITMNNANILSSHITASTPVLSGRFTAVDLNDITGNIDFASGTISDPAGKLELRKTRFSLPLFISSKRPARQQAGIFTVQDVFFNQQREGSFSGAIRHFMHLPSGVTDTLSHQIDLSGKLQSDKFGKTPITLNSSWQLPPEKNCVKCFFSMPESKLAQPVVFSNYLKLPVNCAALRGTFTLDGNAEFSSEKSAEGVIKLNSINADWQFGSLAAEGVTAAGVLNFSNMKYSFMPQDTTVSKILWNNVQLLDNELNISLNSDDRLQISNWQGTYLGGKFRSIQLPSVHVNQLDKISPMKFSLQDMPITTFFNALGIKCFASDALLNGDIQLSILQNKFYADSGVLSFKSPAGKILQMQLTDPSAIKIRDVKFRDFTMAVLKAMKCYQANFNFSTTPKEIVMQVKADGVPAEPVPFVYQGRGSHTPFRPAEPGESGFAGEIELNINLKLHPDKPDA